MIRIFALILSIIMLLTLTACGKTIDDSISPNEPSISNEAPEPETTAGLEATPNDFSDETEQVENGESAMTDTGIATDDLTPKLSPSAIPTTTSTSTPVPATESPSISTEPTPTVTPQQTQTPVESTPTPTFIPKPTLTPTPLSTPEPTHTPEPKPTPSNISITVGGSVFSVKLHDNDTARDFLSLLPMTLNMSELNGNEKYYYLPDNLSSDSGQVGSINTGDLMLYGSDCLVLFYESISTSYSYTRIGYVEDVTGLAAALGSSGVKVSFAVSE